MAHYALLDDNNIVTGVIVGNDETDQTYDWEQYYGNFHNCTCKRTSYNTVHNTHKTNKTPFRGNYAGIGSKFYSGVGTDGVFMSPKPYDSWVMSTADCTWTAPSAMPTDGNSYEWDEDNQTWINLSGSSSGGV